MRPAKRIDDAILLKLHEQDLTFAEIGQHFGVSAQAAHKRFQQLKRRQLPASFQSLTPQQQGFVKARASGKSATQAALESYNCRSLDSAKNIGSQLQKQPAVAAAMADWLQWAGLGRQQRAEKLVAFVNNPESSVAFPALKEAMKVAADYPPARLQVDSRAVCYVISLDPNDKVGQTLEERGEFGEDLVDLEPQDSQQDSNRGSD